MSSDVSIVRFVFNWPNDRGMRRFLMQQCAMEIYEYESHGRFSYPSRYCDCEGIKSSVMDARFTVRLANWLPVFGFRWLGLKELWLELMGCRIAMEAGGLPIGGLDALRVAAADKMNIDPVKAGRMTVDDLYRVFCSAPLAAHWQNKRDTFLEHCARTQRNPARLPLFARR